MKNFVRPMALGPVLTGRADAEKMPTTRPNFNGSTIANERPKEIAANVLSDQNQVGTAQVGTAQVGTAQVGTAQVGTAQVGVAQVGVAQVGTAQVGTAQVGAFACCIILQP